MYRDARITEIYEGTSENPATGDCGLGVEELLKPQMTLMRKVIS